MVRILSATAIKYAWKATDNSKTDEEVAEDVLLDIIQSQNRNRAEPPLPPFGLCFAGVGYDAVDMSFYKYMPYSHMQALQQEYDLPSTYGKFT